MPLQFQEDQPLDARELAKTLKIRELIIPIGCETMRIPGSNIEALSNILGSVVVLLKDGGAVQAPGGTMVIAFDPKEVKDEEAPPTV